MKKLLISLFIICSVLLSGVYFVGEMSKSTIQRIASKSEQQEVSIDLLSYEKQFFKSTFLSQLTVALKGGQPIVFAVTSVIQHYPHKAVINNQIHLRDPELAKKVEDYFGSENWITSTEEISLLGNVTGHLQLLSGRYKNADEQLATKALQLDYLVDLQDYSGSLHLSWHGLDAQTKNGNLSIDTVKLRSDFASLPIADEYDYVAEIARVVIQQKNRHSQLQQIELQGSSRSGEQADTVDSSNEWRVGSYRVTDNSVEKVFTDNLLQLDLKGLYAPALMLLSNASGDQLQVTKALTVLMAHGGQLSLKKLSSQTPWGEVDGTLELTLQQGAQLSEVVINPFMLLDYVSGNANLFLPEALLQLPVLSESLQIGLQSGILKKQKKILSLETQFKQGELIVNGRVIPL